MLIRALILHRNNIQMYPVHMYDHMYVIELRSPDPVYSAPFRADCKNSLLLVKLLKCQ